jgi:uracil-DNA glycosylase family 4
MKIYSRGELERHIISCRKCKRLVQWRERVSQEKVKRFEEWEYWGKPIPGFGDIKGQMLIIGLAPAAHGGNRTGRIFTGDRSGNWLYRALFKAGFASQPNSEHRKDGMILKDCYITAACRCAPPANKPAPSELQFCRAFLRNEIVLMRKLRVVITLGRIAFYTAWKAFIELEQIKQKSAPKFSHLVEKKISDKITLIGSYHPSQQNTFTRRLTEPMFDEVFSRAKNILYLY